MPSRFWLVSTRAGWPRSTSSSATRAHRAATTAVPTTVVSGPTRSPEARVRAASPVGQRLSITTSASSCRPAPEEWGRAGGPPCPALGPGAPPQPALPAAEGALDRDGVDPGVGGDEHDFARAQVLAFEQGGPVALGALGPGQAPPAG